MTTTETIESTGVETEHKNIFDRAIIIGLTLARPGNRRKLSNSLIETEADKSMLHVSKDLLDSPELKAVEKKHGEIRRFISDLCLPSPLGQGHYLLSIPLVPRVIDQLRTFKGELEPLVAAAVTAYPERKQQAKERLGPGYNELDYPSEELYEQSFHLSYRFITFGVPSSLESISSALYEEERRKFEQGLQDNLQEITAVMRMSLKSLIDHMVERLETDATGKPKKFKNSTVENLAEFLQTFRDRNIADDNQLNTLVEDAKRVLDGVKANDIRTNNDLRNYVRTQMAQIQTTLGSLVTSRTRMVLDDDEETAA